VLPFDVVKSTRALEESLEEVDRAIGIAALVAAGVAFLVYYTWPRLTMPERMMRLAVLGLITAITIVQAVPRG
jgi:hypothetical protein